MSNVIKSINYGDGDRVIKVEVLDNGNVRFCLGDQVLFGLGHEVLEQLALLARTSEVR